MHRVEDGIADGVVRRAANQDTEETSRMGNAADAFPLVVSRLDSLQLRDLQTKCRDAVGLPFSFSLTLSPAVPSDELQVNSSPKQDEQLA